MGLGVRTKEILRVLMETGLSYQAQGRVSSVETHVGHDVHAFYRLTEPSNIVIHVQSYPGMSSDDKMRISARARDYTKMLEQRLAAEVSIGNEHEANIPGCSSALNLGVDIPYEERALQQALRRECEFL